LNDNSNNFIYVFFLFFFTTSSEITTAFSSSSDSDYSLETHIDNTDDEMSGMIFDENSTFIIAEVINKKPEE